LELSKKQEHFCQEYVKDSNATRSYKIAYPTSLKWKDSAVWSQASRLLKNSKVSARITSLKKELSNKKLWTREKSVKILSNIAIDTDSKAGEKTQAVKELNLMHGFNEPIKVDNLSSDGSMSPKKLDIADFYASTTKS
jgi:phage terminase small subunit